MALTTDQIRAAMLDPRSALNELDKYQSEQSLLQFMVRGWHVLEPARPLQVGRHLHIICDHLEAAFRGEITRLAITVPPGCSKSMSVNVFNPSWQWIHKPENRFISAAHEMSLSRRDNKRGRDLVTSDWYQNKWDLALERDQNEKTYFQNTKTGFRQAASSISLTGKRGDQVIYDDPLSVKAGDSLVQLDEVLDVFTETLPTRLNDIVMSSIVIIMQRIHMRDPVGFALENDLGYTLVSLPMEYENERCCYTSVRPSWQTDATRVKVYYNRREHAWTPDRSTIPKTQIEVLEDELYKQDWRNTDGELLDPVRFPEKEVNVLKKALSSKGGSYAVASQLQQRPVAREGGMFSRDWFKIIDKPPECTYMCRGWDFAASDKEGSPFSVGTKMGYTPEGYFVILDVAREQKIAGKLEKWIGAILDSDGLDVLQDMPQDPGSAGKIQKFNYASKFSKYNVRFSPESGNKELRAEGLSAAAENGIVLVVRASWNDTYLSELNDFPKAGLKDQVDASSRAYARLQKMIGLDGDDIMGPEVGDSASEYEYLDFG